MKGAHWLLALFAAVWFASPAWSGTIEEGQARTVEGKVAAVDVANRAVVVHVPASKGDLTVGVTLKEGLKPVRGAKEVSFDDLSVGDPVILKYTREADRLIGLKLQLRR